MKFLDGGWLVKEGYEVEYPAHVYATRKTDKQLTVYAPFRHIADKGGTLDGGMMTVELSSPHENIIGVKVYHHKGSVAVGPSFELNKQNPSVEITDGETEASLKSGALSAHVKKGNQFEISFEKDGEVLTSSKSRGQAYIRKPLENQSYISEQLTIDVGELVYGLGERFTSFVKNGQTVDIWNADGGTGTEQAYKNIPFYMTNRGYGVFVNSPKKVSYEIGSEKVSRVQFSVPGEEMEYFIIAGDSMKEVLENYTNLTGKPALPPAWTFGLWMSTSFLTDYDEATVNHFVDGMIDRDIPLEVFHFDCLWMEEYEWVNFEWDKRTFPEPQKMLTRLKEKGLKICVWINPYVGQKSPLFDEGMEKGYFIKRPNGDVWQWDKWQAGLAIIDFTNPEAVTWYQNHLAKLMDMGVDSFKTDFGERIPVDAVYYDGSDPERMHNYYTQLYNQIVFDLSKSKNKDNEAVVFARSATVGGQKFPVHWGGDSTSDYPSMAESLRAGLSFGMSGFGYWSHDIGGFEEGCTPDLYKRWTQFGLLSSHSRYHGSKEYKVPWIYDEEAVDVTRSFTKLKLSLMPYLMNQAVVATEGIPMMRSMVLEFPEDMTSHTLDRQFMLGDSLLVAPIFNDKGTVNYYVPEGTWTNYLTNEKIEGGKWHNETHGYDTLPLLARPNSIIVEGNQNTQAEYNYAEAVTLHVFELSVGAIAKTRIVDRSGKVIGTAHVQFSEGAYTVNAENIDVKAVLFHNVHDVDSVESGKMEATDLGTMVYLDGSECKIQLTK
ncbi:alpha-xylosidase [Marinilactibacillus sp. XAAS-LB27]|uniref:alpha-xylosidase n=1 Tax=Marinilactibacillus sp. XAAS-LB27 TaxID=3114538 RepID=UPI002E1808FA|nr:alpha-xylosidase [Marinilactibacillus sp. XAAS-LB27]